MDFLTQLWLPILVSGVVVWIASFVFWMAIGHHNKDVQAIPGEKEFKETINRLNIQPGNYGFPDFHSCKGMSKEEKMKLYDSRPMGLLRVWAPVNMGVNMLLTFLFYLITSTVIGYLGWAALPHTHDAFGHVMQVLGTAGILAYCFASFPNDLWFQKSKRSMLMNLIDGVVFGLITGAIFAWLWPK